jgi:hypothetical protein
MREAGFSNVSLFCAGFSFHGWVAYAQNKNGPAGPIATGPTSRVGRRVMICLSGANAFASSPVVPPSQTVRPQDRLRRKANFSRVFNSMTPVQISREKYSALRSAEISRIFLVIPPRAEGRFAIVTDVEAGSGGRERSQHSLENADERSLRGRPSRVVLALRCRR